MVTKKPETWSLVWFTLLVQAGCGTFCLWVLQSLGVSSLSAVAGEISVVSPALALALVSSGGVLSFSHLGRPLNARYCLKRLSTSWLSREALLTSLLIFCQGSLLWHGRQELTGMMTGVAVVAVCFACALIYAIARIYMLRTVPGWNRWLTIGSFYCSALLLGLLGQLLLHAIESGVAAVPQTALQLVCVTALAQFLFFVESRCFTRRAGSVATTGRGKLCNLLEPIAISRLLLTILGGGLLLGGGTVPLLFFLAIGCLVAAEVTGRHLFYQWAVREGY